MFVFNGFRHDTRVLKQAATLAAAGHEVRVIASLEPGMAVEETVGGIRVARAGRHLERLAAWLARAGVTIPPPAGGWSADDDAVETSSPPRYATASLPARGPRAAVNRVGARVYRRLAHARFRRCALALGCAEAADVWVAHDLDTLQIADRARRRLGGGLVYDSH